MKNKNQYYEQVAKDLLSAVGGSANISSVTHCMTRLRFNLKDESIPNDNDIQSIPGVVGVNRTGGQYQIIIGQTVNKVYDFLLKTGDLTQSSSSEDGLDENLKEKLTFKSIANNILNKLAGCLTPLIPMMVAASVFKMLGAILGPNMLNFIGTKTTLYQLFTFVGDAGFYFLPIVIGYTASKQFNTSRIIAMFLGAIVIDLNLIQIVKAGKPFDIFGITMPLINYSSTVIPIILAVWVMSYIEQFFKQHTAESISTIMVPTLTIAVMLPIMLCILGPAGNVVGNYICAGILAFGKLGGLPTIIAVGVIGAFWEILVMTGMHLLMLTTMMMIFAQSGHENFVTLGAVAASMSVAGMCLGAALRIKDKDQKALAWSYLIASFVGGVTEPGLYGLAIRYKRPFIGMMVGGFCGGLYAGMTAITAYVMVPVANFLSLTTYVGGQTNNLVNGVISGTIAFVVAAIATYSIGIESKTNKQSNEQIKLVEA